MEKSNKKLITAIIQTAEETIPTSAGGKRNKNVSWWDDNCSKVIKRSNRAFRQLKAHHTLGTLVHSKRAQATVQKTIRSISRAYIPETIL